MHKYLVLHFTCPFQIASDRWLACCVNTDVSMGPGSAWLIRLAFATTILQKNDKQLARNRYHWKQKQKQSKKDSQKRRNRQHSLLDFVYHFMIKDVKKLTQQKGRKQDAGVGWIKI